MPVDYFIKNCHLILFERFIICDIAVLKIKECDECLGHKSKYIPKSESQKKLAHAHMTC